MRDANRENIRSYNFCFPDNVFLTSEIILKSIQHCYDTLDMIDRNLVDNGLPRLSKLVEVANLSSIVGNLIAAGIVKYSNNQYYRNEPNTYPDILPVTMDLSGIELKTAIERNRPKGHLPKEGFYIIYRYVLTDEDGIYERGKNNRGDVVTIWEVKFGYLKKADFDLFNSEYDSGKTAVISSEAHNKMKLLYFDPYCSPYNSTYRGYN